MPVEKYAGLLVCGSCAALVAGLCAVTGFEEPAPVRQTLLYAAYAGGGVMLGWLVLLLARRG